MPEKSKLNRGAFFIRIALAIALIVIVTNLTTAVFFSLRFNSLNAEQRQQIALAIAEGRSPETAMNIPPPIVLAGPFSLVVPIGLGLIMAWVFSLRVARPIEAINRAAADLSAGKLDTRVELKGQFGEFFVVSNTLNQVAESLERLETERKSMIADIAHELRTPLTAIRTRLEGLEDGLLEFTPTEVQKLQHHTLLLSRLVDDLRTLSLADAGQLSLHRREMDIQDWLEGIVEQFKPKALEKNINLVFLPPTLFSVTSLSADPDRLNQVMNNLITNALRHTPTDGTVSVQLEGFGQSLRISVQDSGPGIPEEALPHVFERFYRADSSRSRDTGGSGLGLAIVKAIVQLHGGQVEAYNAKEGGAVFSLELPRV